MTDDDRDDPLDPMMLRAARAYNTPPLTPKDAMWKGITAARARQTVPAQRRRLSTWALLGVGLAATLVIGVGLGRYSTSVVPTDSVRVAAREPQPALRADSVDTTTTTTMSAAPATDLVTPAGRQRVATTGVRALPPGSSGAPRPGTSRSLGNTGGSDAYEVAALRHLGQAEALLTAYRSDEKTGRYNAQVATWARDLLSQTRLLIDSPASEDPTMAKLLDDLELVLAQIALRSPANAVEAETIDRTFNQRDVLGRLRTAIPAKARAAGTLGESE